MKKFCAYPFWHAEIDCNGDVTCCCPDFTNFYYFGNIFKQPFEEIWHGEKWENFRKDILSGKNTHCRMDMCQGLDDSQFCTKEYIDAVKNDESPVAVTLSLDTNCNVKCIFCRDWQYPLSKEENERIMSRIDNYFLPMVKNTKRIDLNGAGEFFVSKFYRHFIKRVSETYPDIKFEIYTNGLLCDEKNLKEIGLYDKIYLATISLHATTEKTYNKIVKGSDFNRVVKNIKFMSELKKQGIIKELALTFVVTSYNYKEIPDFVEFAVANDAVPNIWPVRPYNDCRFCRNIEKYDITRKTHPKHDKLLEVLQSPVLKKYHTLTNGQITSLLEE